MKSRILTDAERAEIEALIAQVDGELVTREAAAARAEVPDLAIEITGVDAREPGAVEDPVARLRGRVEALVGGPMAKATPEALRRVRGELRAALPPVPRLPPKMGDIFASTTPRLLARARGDERPVPLPWRALADIHGGGLWPGMHVVVGGTGTGKTGLAMQIAIGAAKAGAPTVYIPLELGEVDITTRAAALSEAGAGARVFASDLAHGRLDEARASEVLRAAGDELAGVPFYVEQGDPYVWSPGPGLRGTIEALSGGAFPVFVVLDFLQLVGGDERRDLRERIGRAAYALRDMARDHNAVILILSSVARASEHNTLAPWGRAWPEPGPCPLRDLVGLGKESGEIEFGADSVTVIAETDRSSTSRGRRFRVGVAKMRNGTPGELTLCFNGTRWLEDLDGPVEATTRSQVKAKPLKLVGSLGAERAAGDESGAGDEWK